MVKGSAGYQRYADDDKYHIKVGKDIRQNYLLYRLYRRFYRRINISRSSSLRRLILSETECDIGRDKGALSRCGLFCFLFKWLHRLSALGCFSFSILVFGADTIHIYVADIYSGRNIYIAPYASCVCFKYKRMIYRTLGINNSNTRCVKALPHCNRSRAFRAPWSLGRCSRVSVSDLRRSAQAPRAAKRDDRRLCGRSSRRIS